MSWILAHFLSFLLACLFSYFLACFLALIPICLEASAPEIESDAGPKKRNKHRVRWARVLSNTRNRRFKSLVQRHFYYPLQMCVAEEKHAVLCFTFFQMLSALIFKAPLCLARGCPVESNGAKQACLVFSLQRGYELLQQSKITFSWPNRFPLRHDEMRMITGWIRMTNITWVKVWTWQIIQESKPFKLWVSTMSSIGKAWEVSPVYPD